MSDLNCPYCNAELKVCHDDGFGYAEDEAHEMECYKCDKSFVFYTFISIDYESRRADCLNGSDHRWEQSYTHPRRYTKMICQDCGERRDPTEEEMALILEESK